MTDIAERVAKGAAFLDESQPGWDARIDLKDFSLGSPCRCVLGQLAADLEVPRDWQKLCRQFGVSAWHPEGGRPSDWELGFNVVEHGEDDEDDEDQFREWQDAEEQEYTGLTAEWRRVIAERQAAS